MGTVIGIAPSFSPVAKQSDIALEIDAEEEFQIFTNLFLSKQSRHQRWQPTLKDKWDHLYHNSDNSHF